MKKEYNYDLMAKNLRFLFKENIDKKQIELAELIPCNRSTISKYVKGERKIKDEEIIEKIAAFFDISIDAFKNNDLEKEHYKTLSKEDRCIHGHKKYQLIKPIIQLELMFVIVLFIGYVCAVIPIIINKPSNIYTEILATFLIGGFACIVGFKSFSSEDKISILIDKEDEIIVSNGKSKRNSLILYLLGELTVVIGLIFFVYGVVIQSTNAFLSLELVMWIVLTILINIDISSINKMAKGIKKYKQIAIEKIYLFFFFLLAFNQLLVYMVLTNMDYSTINHSQKILIITLSIMYTLLISSYYCYINYLISKFHLKVKTYSSEEDEINEKYII